MTQTGDTDPLRGGATGQETEHRKDSTYGVELEFVFAFHEDGLEIGDTNGVPNKLRKKLTLDERESDGRQDPNKFNRLDTAALPGHRYNSWGVERPTGSNPGPYRLEPLELLQRKLRAKLDQDLDVSVYGTLTQDQKTSEKYSKWSITVDHSVCGVGSNKISEWLPGYEIDPEDWDSYGVELVSPVYRIETQRGDEAIRKITEAVKGTSQDPYGSFVTNQCGLHVHVQAPEDWKVLQELAIILLIYEEEISGLHPQCRRPGHDATRGNIYSNRIALLLGEGRQTPRYQFVKTSTSDLRKKLISIADIESTVISLNDKQALVEFMNCSNEAHHPSKDRNRLVNFTSANRGTGFPSTVEFRQALGSLDPDDIIKWVDFCIGLVRVAEYYQKYPEKFPVTSWDKRVNVFDLIRDMGLGQDAENYWARKQAYYKTRSRTDREWQTDNEEGFSEPGSSSDDGGPGDDGNDDDDQQGPRSGTGGPGGQGPAGAGGSGSSNQNSGYDKGGSPGKRNRPSNQGSSDVKRPKIDESMTRRIQPAVLTIHNFRSDEWVINDKTETWMGPKSNRANYSAAFAILDSFKAQYPTLSVTKDAKYIADQLDHASGSAAGKRAHRERAVAQVVHDISGGTHNIVVLKRYTTGKIVQRYIVPTAKKDLLLCYTPGLGGELNAPNAEGRWQGMQKKSTFTIKNAAKTVQFQHELPSISAVLAEEV